MTREQVELIRQRAEGCEQATLSGDDVRGLCDFALDHARREGVVEGLEIAEKCVPINWLDPLLTGPDAVLREGFGNREIEALLRGVQDRIHAEIERLRRGE